MLDNRIRIIDQEGDAHGVCPEVGFADIVTLFLEPRLWIVVATSRQNPKSANPSVCSVPVLFSADSSNPQHSC